MGQFYYTKDEKHLLDVEYNKIRGFGIYDNSGDLGTKIVYEGDVWDVNAKKFINPKDFGDGGRRITIDAKFINCYWILLEITPEEFMSQMCGDLCEVQRELDIERLLD